MNALAALGVTWPCLAAGVHHEQRFFFSFVNLNDMFSTAALVLCLYLQGTFWIVYDRERERLQALAFICKGRASFQPKAYVG